MVCPNCGSNWSEGASKNADQRPAPRMRLRPSVWRTSVERGAVCPTCIQIAEAHEAPASKNRKLMRACIVAPLATPLVIDICGFFVEGLPRENILTVVLVSSSLYLPFAYAAEIFLGLPLFAIFFRYRIRSMAAFALGGAFIGWVVSLALAAGGSRPFVSGIEQSGWFRSSLPFALAASVSAVVFRAIAQTDEAS
jgi:hypothetical protein